MSVTCMHEHGQSCERVDKMFAVSGDNILTAVSVARQCGMVAPRESIILASAYVPEEDKPALIEWKNIGDEQMEGEHTVDENGVEDLGIVVSGL